MVIDQRSIEAGGQRLVVQLYERNRTLDLHVTAHGRGAGQHRLRLEMSLAHPVYCQVTEGRTTRSEWTWNLEEVDDAVVGPFERVADWIDRTVSSLCSDSAEPMCELSMVRGEEIVNVALRRAFALCDAAARAVVLHLPTEARFFAYAALLSDPSGRVGQMIDVCPCLFVLGAVCNSYGSRTARLRAGIRAGRPLHELIELMLPVVDEYILVGGTLTMRNRAAAALIRRAPAIPLHDLLGVLYAPGVDVNDLVHAGTRIARWYAHMTSWADHARELKDVTLARRLGGFISRHSLALTGGDDRDAVTELVDWMRATNAAVPSRTTSPARVRRSIDTWHVSTHRNEALRRDTPLALGPTASEAVPGISVRRIETVGQLVDEGREMQHCVAKFADAASTGTLCVYAGEVLGERITIALAPDRTGPLHPRRWRVEQAAGYANKRLSPPQLALVKAWLSRLQERSSEPLSDH